MLWCSKGKETTFPEHPPHVRCCQNVQVCMLSGLNCQVQVQTLLTGWETKVQTAGATCPKAWPDGRPQNFHHTPRGGEITPWQPLFLSALYSPGLSLLGLTPPQCSSLCSCREATVMVPVWPPQRALCKSQGPWSLPSLSGACLLYSIFAAFLVLTTTLLIKANKVIRLKEAHELFKMEVFIKMIVDSLVIVRKNTERACESLFSFPNGDILLNYSMTSQSGYWHWCHPLVLFWWPLFYVHHIVCVCACMLCLVLCNFSTCVGSCIHHYSEDGKKFLRHGLPPVALSHGLQ